MPVCPQLTSAARKNNQQARHPGVSSRIARTGLSLIINDLCRFFCPEPLASARAMLDTDYLLVW